MVRKQVLLSSEQNGRLGAFATASSRSEGELVREALDDWFAKQKIEQDDWKVQLRQLRGMWKERTDLDQHFEERRERRRHRRERMMRAMPSGEG